MGIKKLKKLLNILCKNKGVYNFENINDFINIEKERLYQEIIEKNNITDISKKIQIKNEFQKKPYLLGIDTNLYATKYKRVFKKIEYGFLRQIILFLSAKIIPIYIFDGIPPEEKKNVIKYRKDKKNKTRTKLERLIVNCTSYNLEDISKLETEEIIKNFNIFFKNYKKNNFDIDENLNDINFLLYEKIKNNNEYDEFIKLTKKTVSINQKDIEELKNFLKIIKIPYIEAESEADDLISFLYNKKYIDACLSEDMDMLPKGCHNVIQINNKKITQYYLPKILETIDLNIYQFIDFCILLGCDYNNEYKIKMKEIDLYNYYKKINNPNIENFIECFSREEPEINKYLTNYQKSRYFFSIKNENFDQKKLIINIKPFNIKEILLYFKKHDIMFSYEQYSFILIYIKNINKFINTIKNKLK